MNDLEVDTFVVIRLIDFFDRITRVKGDCYLPITNIERIPIKGHCDDIAGVDRWDSELVFASAFLEQIDDNIRGGLVTVITDFRADVDKGIDEGLRQWDAPLGDCDPTAEHQVRSRWVIVDFKSDSNLF